MKRFIQTGLIFGMAVAMTSCFNNNAAETDYMFEPNYQYMPNMYEAVGYETYSEAPILPHYMEAQHPAEGTIKRGWLPYEYPDTNEGYEAAKANLESPLDSVMAENTLAIRKELYTAYCAICHGAKGDGKGHLATTEKFLGIPSYADREITEGSVYHVIYYGKNAMGSYASQLNETERWQVTEYVMDLRKELVKE